jgi:hypothetical protein
MFTSMVRAIVVAIAVLPARSGLRCRTFFGIRGILHLAIAVVGGVIRRRNEEFTTESAEFAEKSY